MSEVQIGDIVQATPDADWSCAFVVVTEVKSWGIQGYSQSPHVDGQTYIRLASDKFERTGGRAVFMPGREDD